MQQRLLLLGQSSARHWRYDAHCCRSRRSWKRSSEADSATQRLARFRLLGLIAIIILNLFNLTDLIMLPDIAAEALRIASASSRRSWSLRLPPYVYPARVGQWREWLLALLILLAGGSLIYFFTRSHHP